jgi:Protein of unknown function (DUF3099)
VKSSNRAPSATSLPRAPRDEAGARSARYLVMMGIRIVCFILMVVITPYGWYTWVLGAAAILLPYLAVVSANVGEEARSNRREDPERALPAAPRATTAAPPEPQARVIRIEESRPVESRTPPPSPDQPDRTT